MTTVDLAREATEFAQRKAEKHLELFGATGIRRQSPVPVHTGRSQADIFHESSHLVVQRDPCVRCGVRRDLHDRAGCGIWRAAP